MEKSVALIKIISLTVVLITVFLLSYAFFELAFYPFNILEPEQIINYK